MTDAQPHVLHALDEGWQIYVSGTRDLQEIRVPAHTGCGRGSSGDVSPVDSLVVREWRVGPFSLQGHGIRLCRYGQIRCRQLGFCCRGNRASDWISSACVAGLFAIVCAAQHNYRGYRMFEDKLLGAVRFQDQGILVERPDFPGELYPADQIDGDHAAVFARRVQKRILDVLCAFVGVHEARLQLI